MGGGASRGEHRDDGEGDARPYLQRGAVWLELNGEGARNAGRVGNGCTWLERRRGGGESEAGDEVGASAGRAPRNGGGRRGGGGRATGREGGGAARNPRVADAVQKQGEGAGEKQWAPPGVLEGNGRGGRWLLDVCDSCGR